MALPSYSTGTATVMSGGTSVALTDATTAFNNVFAGDTFCIGTASATVIDIVDDEHFTITPWPGSDETNAAYTVLQDSKLRFTDVEIAIDLKKQVQALNTEGFYHFVAPQFADPDAAGLTADDGQYAFQASTGNLWVMQSAVWTFLGVYKGFGFKGSYDSGVAYALNDVVTFGGSSYIVTSPTTGNQPPNALYYDVLSEKGADSTVPGPSPWTEITTWATATAYVVGPPASAVTQGGETYVCLIAHTSGSFSTDLAAGKWIKVAAKGADGSGTGDVVGPASATDAHIVLFDTASGKAIKDSGKAISDLATAAQGAKADSAVQSASIREKLTANRTYYADNTNGNDSNNGLSAGTGNAFKTVQKAYDLICASLDLAGFTVTIQLADATYAPASGVSALLANKAWTGGGSVIVQGNAATPASVVLSTTSANAVDVTVTPPGNLTVRDLKIQTATAGDGVALAAPGLLTIGNLNFGACAGSHVNVNAAGANVSALSGYAISGSAAVHVNVNGQSKFTANASTVTLSGTPNFSVRFANALGAGYADFSAASFSGAATGQRYGAFINGMIFSNGGSATFFPGSVAGTTGTGGQYN